MFSYEDWLRAVQLYIKLGKRIGLTIRQLGYPTKNALLSWHREYEQRLELPTGYVRKPRYSQTHKELAVGHYLEHGRCIAATIRALGYPSRSLLSAWSVSGVRPFTEKMNSESQFKLLAVGNVKLSANCNAVLKVAAEDLNEYRNGLVHGYLISFGEGSTPSFMKNPGWNHTKRNKPVGDAYVNEPFQDLVLIAAWTLFGLMRQVENSLQDTDAQRAIESMESDVQRARSYASEARHLRTLMNAEKY